MLVKAKIKKVATGESREYTQEFDDIERMFSDGNYACDCNRSLFFGEEQDECSDDRFLVQLSCENEVFYDEFNTCDFNLSSNEPAADREEGHDR